MRKPVICTVTVRCSDGLNELRKIFGTSIGIGIKKEFYASTFVQTNWLGVMS